MKPLRLKQALCSSALAVVLGAPKLYGQRPIDIRRAVTATASVRISGAFAELHIRGWNKDSVAITGDTGGAGGGTTNPWANLTF